MLYCLDTSIVIDILRGDKSLLSKIEAFINQHAHFCITPIALAELYKGAYLAEKQKEAIKLVEDFTKSVELLDFTESACKVFGQKYLELKTQGRPTQETDLMIGSITLEHGAILVTRDMKDFANIKGLKIINW